jgi:hypothetical protein
MNRCLLALLLVVCGTVPVVANDDVVAALDGCIHNLDPNLDVGYRHVAERCPELVRALAASPYVAWLPPDWSKPDNELSVGGLVELRRLLTRIETTPAVQTPRIAQLADVLKELHRSDTVPRGWWARLKQWLRGVFTPQPSDAEQGWLARVIGGLDLSQRLTRAIVWGALLVLLLLAGAVVANELRVAGWWERRLRHGQRLAARAAAGSNAAGLEEVEWATRDEQPHLLLQLVIQRLIELQRLPPARALTLKELGSAARLPDGLARERLAALSVACERARFAEAVSVPVLAAASLCGRELLASLETLHAQPAKSG